MNFIRENWLAIIGIMAGAIGGYLYYYFIGCSSGTCLITSKPLNSTVYGAIMGGLFFSILKKEKINSENNKN
jgi:hypothetical protein